MIKPLSSLPYVVKNKVFSTMTAILYGGGFYLISTYFINVLYLKCVYIFSNRDWPSNSEKKSRGIIIVVCIGFWRGLLKSQKRVKWHFLMLSTGSFVRLVPGIYFFIIEVLPLSHILPKIRLRFKIYLQIPWSCN